MISERTPLDVHTRNAYDGYLTFRFGGVACAACFHTDTTWFHAGKPDQDNMVEHVDGTYCTPRIRQ